MRVPRRWTRAQAALVTLAALAIASPAPAAEGTIRVATVNTWNVNEPFEARIDAIADGLLREGADVVALQEVFLEGDGLRFRTDERLAARLGLEAVTAAAGRVETPQGSAVEGLALLSRWPVLATEARGLPIFPGGRPRTALRATIGSPFGRIDVYTAHLSTDPEERQQQVTELYRFVAGGAHESPPILLGDLNSLPFSLPLLFLTGVIDLEGLQGDLVDTWALLRPGETGATFSTANNPGEALNRRIDYALVRGPAPGDGEPVEVRTFLDQPVVDGGFPSDHLGLSAAFRFTGESAVPGGGGGGGGGGGCAVTESGQNALPGAILILLLMVGGPALRRSRLRRGPRGQDIP